MSPPPSACVGPAATPALSIRLLGPLDVHGADGQPGMPAASKAQELLCYLLLHRGKPVRRETASCLLWGSLDASRCRRNLRQALWQLQSAMGQAAAHDVLAITADTIVLRSGADLWLDLTEFQLTVDDVRDLSGTSFTTRQAAAADRAIRLYRGDLLDDFDFEWCLVEREWLRSTYLMLLDKLMIYCELNGDYDRGVGYGERILRCDRAREYTHRHLMYLHHLRGDRTGALRQYARCVKALDEELSVQPADSTVLLWRHVRDDRDVDAVAVSAAAGSMNPQPRRTGLGGHLRQLQATLGDLQRQVEDALLALEPPASECAAQTPTAAQAQAEHVKTTLLRRRARLENQVRGASAARRDDLPSR
jgi:DNA-binding SARP family transcriptional activator